MAIASPCVKNCCLDKQDVCLGCGRTVDEIIKWGDVGDKEKLLILKEAEKRKEYRETKFKLMKNVNAKL